MRPPPRVARPNKLNLVTLEDRVVPDGRPLPYPVLFAGTDAGHAPTVQAYDAETGGLNFSKLAYEREFTGGVRVAAADITRDTYPDLIVAPGPGGGPRLRVLDGKTGQQIPGPLGNFYAFDPTFTGGLNVAGADVNGDGYPDVIAAAGQGGGPHVKVFSGKDGAVLASFYAFEERFQGGVTVASADFTNDGKAELVVSPGPTGGPRIRILDMNRATNLVPTVRVGTQAPDAPRRLSKDPTPEQNLVPKLRLGTPATPTPLRDFFAFAPDQRSGATVGTDWKAGDVTGDGTPDLLVGSGPGTAPTVRIYSGTDGTLAREFSVFDPKMTAGVRVATAFVTDDPYADVIVATGPGTTNRIQTYDGASINSGSTPQLVSGPLADFAPFSRGFEGGVNIGASNDPPTLLQTETTVLGNVSGEHVTVISKVYDLNTQFEWEYQVTNNSYTAFGYSDGVGLFDIFFDDFIPDVADLYCSPGWPGYVDQIFGSAGVSWMNDGYHQDITPSASGTFRYTTDPRPIGYLIAEGSDSGYALPIQGQVLGPKEKPRVEFRYRGTTGAVVGNDGLKVAKWNDAFNFGPYDTTVRGPDSANLDFIDRDNDRFHVWVYDPTRWEELNANNTPKHPRAGKALHREHGRLHGLQ